MKAAPLGGATSGPRRLGLAAALGLGLVVLVVSVIAGIALGPVRLSPSEVIDALWAHLRGQPDASVAGQIVWQIRAPRVLLAMVIGASLTTAGSVVQALVSNALAEPFLLGVSSGASVGAVSVLLFGTFASFGLWALSIGSVAGALVAMVVVFAIAVDGGHLAPTRLILCGVSLAAMFEAFTSFLLFRGDPQATQSVLFWLLGSFGRATWSQLWLPSLVLAVAVAYLMVQARSLNALSLGAGPSAALGVDVARLRRNLFAVTSIMAGVAVAVSGVIGFIGLVVPHVVRMAVGTDHRRTLPVGVVWGAAFAVAGDLLARTIVAPEEMPMGVITAFIGAPVLIVLVRRKSTRAAATG